MKIHIRYAKKSELPKGLEQLYGPVDPAEPDGPHIFSAFEADPDGYALLNVSQTNAELKALRTAKADKDRQDKVLAKYRKQGTTELWSPEEIASLEQKIAEMTATLGKTPDVEKLTKQLAEQYEKQWEAKVKGASTMTEREKARADFYRDQYRNRLRATAAAEALQGLQAKDGLADIALDTFANHIELEEVKPKTDDGFPDFAPRVRGKDGSYRVNAKGEPITPREFAEGEFVRQRAELFKPRDGKAGTGFPGSGAGGGGGGQGGGGGDPKHGSGKFKIKRSEMLQDGGAFRRLREQAPSTDMVQVLNEDGSLDSVIPGLAKAAT